MERQLALSKLLSQQFSHFFNSYTQAYNKQQDRKGNLFIHRFNRKKIVSKNYLQKVIHYVHLNPVTADLTEFPEQWKFSSYNSIISEKRTLIEKVKVLDLFSDKENFISYHKNSPVEV